MVYFIESIKLKTTDKNKLMEAIMDETVLFDLNYGMYILGANEGGQLSGCIANAMMQITSVNPIFAISINKNNYTYEAIKNTKKFSISILSEQTNPKLISVFGFRTSKGFNKFENCNYEIKHELPVIKENCTGVLFFDLLSSTDMDTHMVVYGQLVDTLRLSHEKPMTYTYYYDVIKGKASKNAPTFHAVSKPKVEVVADAKAEPTISYRCNICGYIHEGDINKEPSSYKCPVCNTDSDNFTII